VKYRDQKYLVASVLREVFDEDPYAMVDFDGFNERSRIEIEDRYFVAIVEEFAKSGFAEVSQDSGGSYARLLGPGIEFVEDFSVEQLSRPEYSYEIDQSGEVSINASAATIDVSHKEVVSACDALITAISEANVLSEDVKKQAIGEIESIKSLIDTPRPNRRYILAMFDGIRFVFKSAAGSAVGQAVAALARALGIGS